MFEMRGCVWSVMSAFLPKRKTVTLIVKLSCHLHEAFCLLHYFICVSLLLLFYNYFVALLISGWINCRAMRGNNIQEWNTLPLISSFVPHMFVGLLCHACACAYADAAEHANSCGVHRLYRTHADKCSIYATESRHQPTNSWVIKDISGEP